MFANDIIIGADTYSAVAKTETYSIYRDASVVSPGESELKIAHDTTKNGRVNSVAILSEKIPTGAVNHLGQPVFETVTGHIKLSKSENPAIDIDAVTNGLIDKLNTLSGESTFKVKFNNLEH